MAAEVEVAVDLLNIAGATKTAVIGAIGEIEIGTETGTETEIEEIGMGIGIGIGIEGIEIGTDTRINIPIEIDLRKEKVPEVKINKMLIAMKIQWMMRSAEQRKSARGTNCAVKKRLMI